MTELNSFSCLSQEYNFELERLKLFQKYPRDIYINLPGPPIHNHDCLCHLNPEFRADKRVVKLQRNKN